MVAVGGLGKSSLRRGLPGNVRAVAGMRARPPALIVKQVTVDYDPRLKTDTVGKLVLPLPRVQYQDEVLAMGRKGTDEGKQKLDDLMYLRICPTCGREVGIRHGVDGDMYECLIGWGGCHSRFWVDAPDH